MVSPPLPITLQQQQQGLPCHHAAGEAVFAATRRAGHTLQENIKLAPAGLPADASSGAVQGHRGALHGSPTTAEMWGAVCLIFGILC